MAVLAGIFLWHGVPAPSADAAEGTQPALHVFYGCGDRGEAVLELETMLSRLGYEVGFADGVYSVQTSRAVRAFQADTGLIADGMCTEATAAAIRYAVQNTKMPSDAELSEALERSGYAAGGGQNRQQLRNAVILFQRTHGLCGTGTAGYASLRALGFPPSVIFGGGTRDRESGRAAKEDLDLLLLTQSLSDLVAVCPAADDLRTLTAAAGMLCNRVRAQGFPDTLSAVCRRGFFYPDLTGTGKPEFLHTGKQVQSVRTRQRIFSAAEAALRGFDPSCGALFLSPAENGTPPGKRTVTAVTPAFFFWIP